MKIRKEQIIKAITDSLGMSEDTERHGYNLYIYRGEWWISHNIVGSGEPVSQWLKRELDKVEIAEIKATPIPSGWICPRCQKVHNWMVQHCDCLPNVITASTTEPKEVAENKVCIHRDGRLCSNANSDYLRCPGECSEAEYPI